jgi:hypothetical protein
VDVPVAGLRGVLAARVKRVRLGVQRARQPLPGGLKCGISSGPPGTFGLVNGLVAGQASKATR